LKIINISKKISAVHILSVVFFALILFLSKNYLIDVFKDALRIAFLTAHSFTRILVSEDVIPEKKALLIAPYKTLKHDINHIKFDFDKDSFLRDKGTYINFSGFMAHLAGDRFHNDVVKLKNGHLSGMTKKVDMQLHAQTAKRISDYFNENKISFLYIQAPIKIGQSDKELPAGAEDFANENADEFLRLLQKEDVNILDLRKSMREDGLDRYDAFFKTDHHWKPEAGIWANGKIMAYLHDTRMIENFDASWSNLDNFKVTVYKNGFLGSGAQRTGKYFAGVDDINLIYPENINLTMSVPSEDLIKSGAFFDVMFDPERIGGDFHHDSYGAYPYHTNNLVIFKNDAAVTDKKILLLSDSFGVVMAPYMALQTEDFDFFFGQAINLQEYIKEHKPDIVMMMYYPPSIPGYFSRWEEQFE
jgi:hypothetical protein